MVGPCVIDLNSLNSLKKHDKIDYGGEGRKLSGLGSADVVGTVILEVSLHPKVKKRQLFNVVQDLGGTILLGRKFLAKFEKLEVNWKQMTLKIDNILIKGDRVIQGGCAESRAYVARDKCMTRESMKNKVRNHLWTENKEGIIYKWTQFIR